MRHPDQEGNWGKAWLLPGSREPEFAASLASWVVNVPGAHPNWEWWLLSVVHLRELVGVPEPKLQYEGAQYELGVFTLDPDGNIQPDSQEGYLYFQPADVAHQFSGVGDPEAITIAGLSVSAMVDGKITPTSEFEWNTLLSDLIHNFHAGIGALN